MKFDGQLTVEGGHDLPVNVAAEAEKCAEQVRSMKTAARLGQLTKGFDLPDGTQVYVADLQHVRRVHVVPPRVYEPEVFPTPPRFPSAEGTAQSIVGVLSGTCAVDLAEFKEVEHWLKRPEEQNIKGQPPHGKAVSTVLNDRVELTKATAKYFEVEEASYKLAVPLYQPFQSFVDPLAQYRLQFQMIKPGMYTGAMSSIVQLLLGVGKLVVPDYEERWYANQERDRQNTVLSSEPTKRVTDPITFEYAGENILVKNTQAIRSLFDQIGNYLQITYDYRWNRTHGVIWSKQLPQPDSVPHQEEDRLYMGRDREPILVELGQRGVLAMPLPRDARSMFTEVREHFERVYPWVEKYTPFREGVNLFDALHGFPNGGNFPGSNDGIDRWVRSGVIAKEEDTLNDFYEGNSFSTAFGWAFHKERPSAINTCYKLEGGRKKGYCYEITINVERRSESQRVRNPLFAEVVAALGLIDKIDLHKAMRLTKFQAEGLVNTIGRPSYEDFDKLEVTCDWTIQTKVALVASGLIDYPAFQCPRGPEPCQPIHSPQFKYYEPMIDSVVNFDFENSDMPARDADGPVFATYANGDPEILYHYARYGDESEEEVENTRQECQHVGSWTESEMYGGTKMAGAFYSSSKDFRKRISKEGGSIKKITAKRIGDADYMAFCHFFGRTANIVKYYFGTHTWEQERWSSEQYYVSVVCASNNRSVYFVRTESQKDRVVKSNGFSGRMRIGSSGVYHVGSILNSVIHWFPCGMTCNEGSNSCYFKVCETVRGYSCVGEDVPTDPTGMYKVCPAIVGTSDFITVTSPIDGAVIQSAYITPFPKAPSLFSKSGPSTWDFEYQVWAMGEDIVHKQKLLDRKESSSDGNRVPQYLSLLDWQTCSLPGMCPVPPWPIFVNYYGPQYAVTSEEFGFGKKEFGRKPDVDAGFSSVPFGAVE